ncbi:[protein-PII] uridylyltransferase family protein [Schlesneria paludicola]|uniref:[protein-PII] uridylyltransferase family protein n=1 Tax=Schlesneria paludicola TaxID=360056 RepID=UPI00029B1577|nr:[glutamate--ammonia-ligase] adenylyltransferase [Schlesneria paludicola]
MNEELPSLLVPESNPDNASSERPARPIFRDADEAQARLAALEGPTNAQECLSRFLQAIAEMSPPDELLVDFQRYVQRSDDRAELYQFLIDNPRAIEMLVKLFAGSRYLTETLLRDPAALRKLIQNRWLADLKTRDEFISAALAVAASEAMFDAKLDAVRRYQRSELLRIGVCDAFGLVDFRAATVQLSLLADGMIETCLQLVAAELGVNPAGFAVIAMGKLGGEELNYSSDIDLVFLTQSIEPHFRASAPTATLNPPGGPGHAPVSPTMSDMETVTLAQRLIKALQDATGEGFLYRVDMRLRPWGRAGELVVRVPAYLDYLRKQAELWEKQALVKARVVAGEHAVGRRLLLEAAPMIFGHPAETVRASVRSAKSKIEAQLERRGRSFGEVKSGSGSIRDIEFVIQSLQLIHGQRLPQIRSANTLTALVRLADFDLIHADEYRCLSEGYVFLRTIEHSLQLLHNRQEHSLPTDPAEITSLARRLDFHDGEHLISHYRQHCLAIRSVYEKYVTKTYDAAADNALPAANELDASSHGASAARTTAASVDPIASYENVFSEDERREHLQRLATLNDEQPVRVDATSQPGGTWRVQVIGIDQPGELSLICGLLFVYGFDIVEGFASTGQNFGKGSKHKIAFRDFVDVFTVRSSIEAVMGEVWHRYESDLIDLVQLARSGRGDEAQGRLASRVAEALEDSPDLATKPSPLEVSFDNHSHDRFTVLRIHGEDTIGFLYELTNALALCGIAIEQVLISSEGDRAADILYVTDAQRQCKILDEARRQELQAAVVLIKHFTHLLPGSPNPEAALLHFRAFVSQLFQQPDWTEQLSSLDRPEVLSALAQLLGVSDFLWEDFLRLQYANLFPVLSDIQGIETAKSKTLLWRDLAIKLSATDDPDERRRDLNDFKDREMFRIDLRHILGRCGDFDQFAEELTDVAEVIVATSLQLNESEFHDRYGVPKRSDGDRASLVVCALGKCGGRELGFASDIELLFVYDEEGMTDGRESIANASFFQRLVEGCVHSIRARQEGIFRIDTRLRPYGRSGPLAVSFDAFKRYFDPNGAAWPYERQALIKLRPITGDPALGEKLIALRDQFLYEGPPFDFASMRAMRERQIRQLVSAGEFNAKLSPGGLVDIEYLVQALQITHGSRHESLRVTNTCIAMDEMRRVGVLSELDHRALRDAYGFFRKLIDALRMVRGDARDLTVSANIGDDFQFLARRLGYGSATQKLKRDLALHSETVNDMVRRLSANGV